MDANGRTTKVDAASSLSVDAREFVPQPFSSQAHRLGGVGAVSDIDAAVAELWNGPEDFFQVASALTQRLETFIVDEQSFKTAVDRLFSLCIQQTNFQNTGARLCQFLATHLTTDFSGNFRSHLLMRCQSEYESRDAMRTTAEGHGRLIHFTIFMAELMKLLLVQGEVVKVFPGTVVELLTLLLTLRTNDSVKWIVNALKLCGSMLDAGEDNKVALDALFTQIKQLIVNDEDIAAISRSQRMNLLNMVELRAAKWTTDEASVAPALYNPYAHLQVEPVEYDAEGQPILYVDEYLGDAAAAAADFSYAPPDADGYNYPANGGYSGEEGYEGGDFAGSLHDEFTDLELVGDEAEQYFVEREDMDPEMSDAYELYLNDVVNRNKTK